MSEKNKSRSSKKWLISRLKTSGSKKRWLSSTDYATTRNAKKGVDFSDLPTHEAMSKSSSFYNGRINTDLLKRFLRTQVGKDWDMVYSEIIARIPNKLMDYKYCIYWYVADKVEVKDGKLWNLRDRYFIETCTDAPYTFKKHYRYMEFYVHPETNLLVRIGDFKSRKTTINMDKVELRKFREQEQLQKLNHKRSKRKSEASENKLVQILKDGGK